MKITQERIRQIRGNILWVCGVVWVTYFAWVKPQALNAFWVTIVGLAWFGTGFMNIVKTQQGKRDEHAEDD